MSHSAAVYSVTVHRRFRPSEQRDLGDFDGVGTSLVSVMRDILPLVKVEPDEGDTTLHVASQPINGLERHEAAAILTIGERGVVGSIRRSGQLRYRREPPDSQDLKSMVLMSLKPHHETGFLAVHVPFRRGTKGLLEAALRELFNQRYDEFRLDIAPVAPRNALQEAVAHDRLRKIRLVALEQSADRFQDASRWVSGGDLGSIELVIRPRRLRRIIPEPLREYLDDPERFRGRLVEFQGMTFDEVKVEVELPSGKVRTLNIDDPTRGRAVTIDIGGRLRVGRDGEPTTGSLLTALRGALADVTGGA